MVRDGTRMHKDVSIFTRFHKYYEDQEELKTVRIR